jgi:hypothetical protein
VFLCGIGFHSAIRLAALSLAVAGSAAATFAADICFEPILANGWRAVAAVVSPADPSSAPCALRALASPAEFRRLVTEAKMMRIRREFFRFSKTLG